MAFLNRNDDDIWGGKTSEGKFNSNNGGGYGRHGSTSGTYGRHNTSSRGQGDDLLAEADDVPLPEPVPPWQGELPQPLAALDPTA